MQTVPLLSMLFFMFSTLGIVLAAFAWHLDSRSPLNRAFIAACLCVAVWSFGFSVAIIAPSESSSLFWNRFAAVGWGSVYAVTLHFTLLFTAGGAEDEEGAGPLRVLLRRSVSPLLYIPAALCVAAFSLAPGAAGQYVLARENGFWVNLYVGGAWNALFYTYCFAYLIAILFLLLRQRRKAREPEKRKQAGILLAACACVFAIGSITDVGNVIFRWAPIPLFAPLYFGIAFGAACFSIRRYNFLKSPELHSDEIILKESRRMNIYAISGVLLMLLGALHVFLLYSLQAAEPLGAALGTGGILFALGLFLSLIRHFRALRASMEYIFIGVILVAIPVLTIHYVGMAGSLFWGVPFLLIICVLVFNQNLVFVAAASSALLSQIFLWAVAPDTSVRITWVIFAGRTALLLGAIAVGSYVNRVYVQRLRENAENSRMQRLITEISTDFVAANSSNIAEKLDRMLETIGRHFKLERCCLCLPGDTSSAWRRPFVWRSDDIAVDDGCVEDFSRKWEEAVGSTGVVYFPDMLLLPRDDVIGRHFLQRNIRSLLSIPIVVNDKVAGYLNLESAAASKVWSEEHRSVMEVAARIAADALAKVEAEARINRMAFYDGLTRLPNRLLFNDRVRQAIEFAARAGKRVGIVFVDLDGFKAVNDTFGHDSGDALISGSAQRMLKAVRSSDTVSRFGGDEFLIALCNIADNEDIAGIVSAVIGELAKPFVIGGQEIAITASAGIAVYPEDGLTAEALIANADGAMYDAKAKGRNSFEFCSGALREEVSLKAKLLAGLRGAVELGELVVYYQPQVELDTETITGVEALVRWEHPDLGLVMPGSFIPLAEQNGYIVKIGEWVLRTSCEQLQRWRRKGLTALRLAVNISAVQLRVPSFTDTVAQILRETGVPPANLELELTESTAIRGQAHLAETFTRLKEIGVSISIDDFGTEYSSLGRLRTLPVDRIKMDLHFVQGIDRGIREQAVTKVIIALARELDLKLTAEGVESATQLDFLKRRMCDEVQGYYYCKPMPADRLEPILFEKRKL